VQMSGTRDRLVVVEAADRMRFLREVAVAVPAQTGAAVPAQTGAAVPAQTGAAVPAQGRVDTVPSHVWTRVRNALTARQPVLAATAPLTAVASALGSAELDLEATNDVLWDEVVAIDPLGEQEVYDATVLGTHNFIADGIAVHNSIEQDADMVILLHREDAYEKESPRAGEADFIVAKHRNGPTATITVAFQGHYSRFVDMNPG
jgi:replicative DNA helicase